MKKFLAIVLAAMMLLSLAACGSKTETKEVAYPTRNISIVCPFAAGGPMDVSARFCARYLEKELGVTITVDNITGGANWTGWGQVAENSDGYTLGFVNFPQQFNYLLPNVDVPYSYKNFNYISNVVHDPNVIVLSAKYHPEIKTFDDFIAAGKASDNLVISTGGTQGSDDDILVEKINATFGTKFVSGRNPNSTEAYTAMLSGSVFAAAANTSEVYYRYKNTDPDTAITVLGVFDAQRSDLIPDIATIKELTGKEVLGSSDRGLVASAKVDQAIVDKLLAAMKKIGEDPNFKKEAAEQGMEGKTVLGADYTKMAQDVEATMKLYYGL